MVLYLARHGKYIVTNNGSDSLSEEGRKETEMVALKLKKENKLPKEIRHSEKLRAKQTAEIIGTILGVKWHEIKGLKPADPIEPILKEIQFDDQDLMLVGHLPFMLNLLSALGQEGIPFINSCVVCLDHRNSNWKITSVISP